MQIYPWASNANNSLSNNVLCDLCVLHIMCNRSDSSVGGYGRFVKDAPIAAIGYSTVRRGVLSLTWINLDYALSKPTVEYIALLAHARASDD